MKKHFWGLAFLLVVAAILFFINLGGYDLWPADEPRFGEVAREMLQSGDHLVLRVNGEPYGEKPPLLFWMIAAVSAPFGDVSAWTARTPSAAAALLTVLLTYLMARRMYGYRVAFWSAAVLMTTSFFWWEARTAQIDMLLTGCLTLSMWAFWHWTESKRGGWMLLFWGGVAAAVYAKGPPGLVFPLLLIFAYCWKRPEERRRTHWIFGAIAAIVLVAIWLIPARLAVAEGAHEAQHSIAFNLLKQTLGRMAGTSKFQWPYYYFIQLPVNLLPWSIFLPWTVAWVWRHRRDGDAMRFLLSWTVPAFIFFTISFGKRSVYLLPLQPALAILITLSVLDLMDAADRARWRKWTAAVFGVFMLVVAAVPVGMLYTEYAHLWSRDLLGFALFCGLLGLEVLYRAFRQPMSDLHIIMSSRTAGMLALCAVLVFPVVNQFKSARYICAPLRTLTQEGVDYRLYSVAFSREEFIFYTGHFHTPVLTDVLDVELPDGTSETAAAKSQRRVRKALAAAVAEVPIADMAHLTQGEIAALKDAAQKAVEEVGVHDALANAFEETLTQEINDFATQFEAPGPAFLFVQADDWRWLVALVPRLADYNVVMQRNVGKRDILLVANGNGAELVAPNEPGTTAVSE